MSGHENRSLLVIAQQFREGCLSGDDGHRAAGECQGIRDGPQFDGDVARANDDAKAAGIFVRNLTCGAAVATAVDAAGLIGPS